MTGNEIRAKNKLMDHSQACRGRGVRLPQPFETAANHAQQLARSDLRRFRSSDGLRCCEAQQLETTQDEGFARGIHRTSSGRPRR